MLQVDNVDSKVTGDQFGWINSDGIAVTVTVDLKLVCKLTYIIKN